MPKRDQTPPYEIMRGSSRPVPPAEPKPLDPASAEDPAEALPVATGRPPWWVGSSSPLVLRVPRGLAALSVAGLVLLIVIAYWVGAVRGAASVTPGPDGADIGDRPGPSGWFEAEQEGYAGPEVGVPDKPLTAERREPGLNYMRLIQSTKADCESLAAFFGAREVAIQLVPVNNSELWTAYAVKRGYRKDELDSESRKLYEQQLRALGRQWKQSGGGADLSTMYFERYNG